LSALSTHRVALHPNCVYLAGFIDNDLEMGNDRHFDGYDQRTTDFAISRTAKYTALRGVGSFS